MEKKTKDTSAKETPLLSQYFRIRQEYPDYLLFFRLGDFYELFFDDAKITSAALDLALTHRGTYHGEKVPMCGVPFHACESYLAKLVRQGFRVAICDQTEDPKEAKKRGYKSVVNREVVRLVTAGTLTEDTLLNAKSNNFIMALFKQNDNLGAAWIDISTGEFHTQSFVVTPENELSIISSLLAQFSPSEIVLPDSYARNQTIYNALSVSCQQVSIWPDERFNYTGSQIRLQKTYQVKTLSSFGDFSACEISSAGALLDYIETTQKGKIPLLQPISKIISGNFMEIDTATRRSLELHASLSDDSKMTLLKAIDRTATSAGGRLLSTRLTAPLCDISAINERLDMIEFFIQCSSARQEVGDLLKQVSDIERALSRLMLGRGGPRDVYNIAQTLELIPNLRNIIYFKSNQPSLEIAIPQSLQIAMKKLGEHTDLVCKIKDALDENNLPFLSRDGGFIKKGYSAALDQMHAYKEDGHKIILSMQDKYIASTGIEHLKVKYNSIIGYFIEVPLKDAEQLLHNPEFIFRQSVLNASRYTTAELTSLEDNVRSAEEKSLAIELELYEELLQFIRASSDEIAEAAQALAEIDVAVGLANLALENNYCRPELDNSQDFLIKAGRHPVVEQALRRQDGAEFVANDCNLCEQNGKLWLLTGPNMAGKSTYLRQNAIIAIMAQMGSYVPAQSAKIGIINRLFSRVGASDDLARGQSTFMVEMVETAAILNKADANSFVILDEIGRGTATFDGLSIAWAVVEYLHSVNRCRTIFATHYHELTSLNDKLPGMSLHCMRVKEFNNQVIFMHEVAEGAADRSYGIHVAKLAGLPSQVTARAEIVLHNIEKQNKGMSPAEIADQLPLFTYAKQLKPSISHLEEAMQKINPDEYSPREALAKLYELKKML